jgi:hypothetical protein
MIESLQAVCHLHKEQCCLPQTPLSVPRLCPEERVEAVLPVSAAVSVAPPVPTSLPPPVLILLRPRPGPFTGAAPAVLTAAAVPPLPKSAVPPLLMVAVVPPAVLPASAAVSVVPPVPASLPLPVGHAQALSQGLRRQY